MRPECHLRQGQKDYLTLDRLDDADCSGGVTVSYEDIPGSGVRTIRLPRGPLAGLRLWLACRKGEALLLNQVDRPAMTACLINALLPSCLRRKLVLYDVFIDTPCSWKRRFVCWMVQGASLNVLFSRFQVTAYARRFHLPEERFIYIPYQSSHSKRPPREDPPGDYIFSGGNSARDYETLCEAVRGTGMRVVVTTTQKNLFDGLEIPPEIEIRPVVEPEFTRLMAGSRFVVMCLTPCRDRGYGEQTILNSGWHGRAMVVADDVSAADYIVEGETGYVVSPCDVEALRARMLELWLDPALSLRMGAAAREHVRKHFTHDLFTLRLRRITQLLAGSNP
jgi:glycosyltransferase involved in cell wall biosynthesis